MKTVLIRPTLVENLSLPLISMTSSQAITSGLLVTLTEYKSRWVAQFRFYLILQDKWIYLQNFYLILGCDADIMFHIVLWYQILRKYWKTVQWKTILLFKNTHDWCLRRLRWYFQQNEKRQSDWQHSFAACRELLTHFIRLFFLVFLLAQKSISSNLKLSFLLRQCSIERKSKQKWLKTKFSCFAFLMHETIWKTNIYCDSILFGAPFIATLNAVIVGFRITAALFYATQWNIFAKFVELLF